MENQTDNVNTVSKLASEQAGIQAALVAPSWACPILLLWYFVNLLDPYATALCLCFSGVLIGLAFRFHGRGVSIGFSLAAVLVYFVIVLSSIVLGITFNGTAILFIPFSLFILGLFSAFKLSQRRLSKDQHAMVWRAKIDGQSLRLKKTHSWWFLCSVSLFMAAFFCFIAMVFVQAYRSQVVHI